MAPTSKALSGSSRTADLDLTGRAIEAADGGEPLGAVKFRALAGSGWRAVRQGDPVRGAGRLTREAARIARGRSEIAPERGDWRFKDPTWKDNPGYRRLMQLYLAWAQEVDLMAASRGPRLARFGASEVPRGARHVITRTDEHPSGKPAGPEAPDRDRGLEPGEGRREPDPRHPPQRRHAHDRELARVHARHGSRRHARRCRVPRRRLRGHPVRAVHPPHPDAPGRDDRAPDQQVLLHGPRARAGASSSTPCPVASRSSRSAGATPARRSAAGTWTRTRQRSSARSTSPAT